MNKKIFVIFLCCCVVFCTGLSVAYYNTRTFGFDENAKVVSMDDEKISVFDFNIYFEDITYVLERVSQITSPTPYTMYSNTPYAVVAL